MANIVRSESNNPAPPSTPSSVREPGSAPQSTLDDARTAPNLSVHGRPIEYSEPEIPLELAWQLIPPATRGWAETKAGDLIKDPVTRKPRRYQWCYVGRQAEDFDGGEYAIACFGKRGLAVARGTADELITKPGKTRWRTARWDIPLDPGHIRHRHGTKLPGGHHEADRQPADHGDTAGSGFGEDPHNPVDDLLDPWVADQFGNLPIETQEFLLEPFARSGSSPQEADVHAQTTLVGRHETEELWVHLFNRRFLAFAYARRSAPTQRKGSLLGSAPWSVAAWTAPALTANKALPSG